jgi:hypothetical protein
MRRVRLHAPAALLAAVAALSACGGPRMQGDVRLPYKAQVSRGDDPRDFAVTVAVQGAALDAIRESVRFPATLYCLQTVGQSDKEWLRDPVSGDWAGAAVADGTVYRGRCTGR